MGQKLTAAKVRATTKPGRHGDGDGLYLFVDGSGRKRWVLRLWKGSRKAGKLREYGLGSADHVTLAQARDMAAIMRARHREGLDPRQDRSGVPTFGELADRYIATHRASWKNAKHANQWDMTLREYAKPLRPMRVDHIRPADVVACLEKIWLDIPETARRVRGRISLVMDAAVAAEYRESNPAEWRRLKHLLPASPQLTRGHMAALPYREAPAFLTRLRALESASALCLEWAILTASRSGEAIGCEWGELDLEHKVWTVPGKRMKSGREHRVPLPGRCLEILERVRPMRLVGSPYVFPGGRRGKPLSDMALTMCLRGLCPGYTVHGFRSTFRDWAGDCTTTPREIVEAALAHVVGDKAEQAYRRGDALERRRDLMDAWASYCDQERADNVVRLRG